MRFLMRGILASSVMFSVQAQAGKVDLRDLVGDLSGKYGCEETVGGGILTPKHDNDWKFSGSNRLKGEYFITISAVGGVADDPDDTPYEMSVTLEFDADNAHQCNSISGQDAIYLDNGVLTGICLTQILSINPDAKRAQSYVLGDYITGAKSGRTGVSIAECERIE